MRSLVNPLKIWFFALAFCLSTVAVSAADELQTPVDRWLQDKTKRYTPVGAPVEWKFAHPAPPVSLLPPIWQSGFDWLQAVTGNGITFKVYGGSALYGMKGGFRAIRSQVADYGTCYTFAEPRGFELLKTFQLPYVAPENPYQTARIINELMATTLKKEFNARGVYPAHVVPVRPLSLMSKTPVRTPADLRGKKVISFMNTPGAAEAIGFAEVHIPFTEIYTALQQGIVDAVIWVDTGFVPFRIYEQARFYTELKVAPATLETCFNQKSFDRLPVGLKQEVYDFQQKVGISVVKEGEVFAVQAKEILQQNGVEIITLSPEQDKLWRSAFTPVVERWMKSCANVGKDCRALVKEIDQLKEKYAKYSNDELMSLAIDQPVQNIIEFAGTK
ncbi:MAG: TRAP transporter substrate-binding protein DctP [Hahellaceae bacterium]|nr:TRAP transporter substrate-binding protein DctP [Hahellaceae bacterium]MCP5211471.1 TRAP transporter substrate-binding protein DctP [Hahellaceae bacterium]